MANIQFKGLENYGELLRQLEGKTADGKMLQRVVAKGAAPVADAIRSAIETIPEEDFRRLRKGEVFRGISSSQKKDLSGSFGLTPIKRDKNGFINTHAGFDGYGSFPTPQYPKGIPNQMLAATVNSGSSVRMKYPFMRTAVRKSRKSAVQAMQDTLDKEMKKIFG